MKQLSKVVLALSFILFTSSAYAEMAKEGSGSYRGAKSGTLKIIGGTGECSGMQGEIELLPRPKVTTSTGAGTYQNMAIANISWKIP